MVRAREIILLLLHAQFADRALSAEEKQFINETREADWKEFITLCEMQKVQGVLFPVIRRESGLAIPEAVQSYLRGKAKSIAVRYYQMISAVKQISKLLDEQDIDYYLLKGVGLSAMYPVEEMRSFGDLDLYIPKAEDLKRAQQIFIDRECEIVDTFSDCHTVYAYKGNGVACEVELHWKLTANFNNGDIDKNLEEIYSRADGSCYATVWPMCTEVRILPPTMNALHLLSHMLQHFMSSGFGLKLFCDWTVFWQKYGDQVDTKQFLGWIERLHIQRFLYAVTGVCVQYLGLSKACCPWIEELPQDKELIDELIRDVWEGGEHGKYDSTRMLITSRKPGLKTYFLELHRQMKRRFKKARSWVPLWPVLWILTGICFLYNNLTLRDVSTKEIMDTNKRRNRLVQKLDIFENK